jgi:hypothetical protein
LVSNIPISTKANRNQTENSIFAATGSYGLSNKGSHCEIDAKSKEGNPKQNHCKFMQKLDETMAKSKTTDFHSGVEQVVRFLEDDDWW